jgi:SAM-dependent methyltransferase
LQGNWSRYLKTLRQKWSVVPIGDSRVDSKEVAALPDDKLIQIWKDQQGRLQEPEGFSLRGWYHKLYAPILANKRVLDVGSGFGLDGMTFAQAGAHVTFLDIVESNLQVVRRLCKLLRVKNVDYLYLKDANSLTSLGRIYDVLWCQGSMICAPFDVAKGEANDLMKRLKPGGRWIELAYPRTRWVREGELPLDKWGDKTDGGAPWIEWYDLEKLLMRLAPASFKPILSFEFHNSDFVWFDLLRNDR